MQNILNTITNHWVEFSGALVGGLILIRNFSTTVKYVGETLGKSLAGTISVFQGEVRTTTDSMNSDIAELRSVVNLLVDKSVVDTKANIKNISVDEELNGMYKDLEDKFNNL